LRYGEQDAVRCCSPTDGVDDLHPPLTQATLCCLAQLMATDIS
jgi:hypothetical protein